MESQRIYLDTSVLGGCFDPEFAWWSNGLMDDFRETRYSPVVSDLLSEETVHAPEPVRALYSELLILGAEYVQVDTTALDLLNAFEAHHVLGPEYRADMLHIALACVARVDTLVSWNFKHIVRFDKIRLFNAVAVDQGYRALKIHSPRQVTTRESR